MRRLSQIRTTAARYAEAQSYLDVDDFDGALAVYNGMHLDYEMKGPQVQEQQRMITYVNVLKNAKQGGRDKWQLNASEVAQLQALRGDHYDRAANWISNLLCYGYGICRPPLTGGGEVAPKARRLTAPGISGPAYEFVTAPNPAESWVTFSYRFIAQPLKAFITVRDAVGKEVATLQINNERGQLVMDTRELAKGMYSVTYSSDGISHQTDKLVVQ